MVSSLEEEKSTSQGGYLTLIPKMDVILFSEAAYKVNLVELIDVFVLKE